MKKFLALTVMLFFPLMASAANAYFSLSNINIGYADGSQVDFGQFHAQVVAQITGSLQDSQEINGLPPSLIYDLTSSSENLPDGAYADADNDPADPNSSITAAVNASFTYGYSEASETYVVNYKANSTLIFGADALGYGSKAPDAYSYGIASLYIGGETGDSIQGHEEFYNLSKKLLVTYSSSSDGILYLYTSVGAYAEGSPQAVPEPSQYGLMIAGLFLISLVRNRKSLLSGG